MCRWIVYQGPPITMSTILFDPGHSLLDQSLHAREIEWPTNGDGFGVGWYARRETPGLFRDVRPIWNDMNLRSLAPQIETRLFFAHIRKATEGGVQRTNCHPFTYKRWLFQHNGTVPRFDRIKQSLYARIAPEFFPHLKGSTDSECLFLLALSFGLEHDPPGALRRMIRAVEGERAKQAIEEGFECTAAASDGQRTWCVRHASHGEQRTLYYSTHREALCDFDACTTVLPAGAAVIASEPLGRVGGAWERVPDSSLIEVSADGIRSTELDLDAVAD